MYIGKVLASLNFTVPQVVNPHIQQNASRFADKAIELPANVGRKVSRHARKVLNKDVIISSQPSVDTVVVTNGASKVAKVSKTNNNTNGKTIKNVLAKYFDNAPVTIIDDGEAKIFEKKKQANLKNLVKSYETADLARREKPSLYSTRLESLRLMQKEAKEQFIRSYEESRLSYGEFVKDIKNGSIPSQYEIVASTAHLK